jgi:tRNA uridine 5-carboxymethylaminomethyl modification enzyme
MVSFLETSVSVAEANPILESRKQRLLHKEINCLGVFSRPQIAMEDVMKFEKVKIYVEENEVDQEILEQAEIKLSIRILKRERNNADKHAIRRC